MLVREQDMGDMPLVVGLIALFYVVSQACYCPRSWLVYSIANMVKLGLRAIIVPMITATISVGRLKEWQIDVSSQEKQQQ